MQTTTEPLLARINERLSRSKVFTISLALHLAAIAILGGIVLVQVSQPEPEDMDNGPGYKFPEHKPEKTKESEVSLQQPPDFVQPKAISEPKISSAMFSPPIVVTNIRPSVGAVSPRVNVPQTNIVAAITSLPKGSMKIGEGMAGRFTQNPSGMILSGAGMGGPNSTKVTERAVLRGLAWLQNVQREDGSWGERNRSAMTGLALLCFLGHGEYGQSPQFGVTVNRAVDWILQNGTAHESRLSMTRGDWGAGNAGVYEHGIGTYALGEYFTMTKIAGQPDERVLELLRGAVGHIVKGQGPDGGWMYSFDKTQSDTSVSGWQVQALKAAHLSGLNIAGVDTALDRAMINFQRVQMDNGAYGYRKAEARWSLTGVGVLCELFWKGARDKETRRGVEFIMDGLGEFPLRYQHEKADLYAWYYHTQAVLMFGGSSWRKWEGLFSKELVTSQSPDGSWPVMSNAAHGNFQKESSVTGAIYRTTLSVLMLESYYRYLPSNR